MDGFEPETRTPQPLQPPTESTTCLQVQGLQVPHRKTRLEHHLEWYPVTVEMSFAVVQHLTNALTPQYSKDRAKTIEHSPIIRALRGY
jgi:hypothetical protein